MLSSKSKMEKTMLEVAKEAAKKGGAIVLKYFHQDLAFEEKENKTLVSIADKESEETIKQTILDAFPNHSIKGEESGITEGEQILWHVDPLDGTTNFKNNLPFSSVSIGIEKDGTFIVGVIYNPYTDELFSAEQGKGAYLNNEKVSVNDQSITKGLIIFDASFGEPRAQRKLDTQQALINQSCRRFRMIGSNALQLAGIANGTFTASLSDTIDSYDFAAGVVLVKEAGGIVTDHLGGEPTAQSKVIIASNNKENHEILLNIVKKTYDGY